VWAIVLVYTSFLPFSRSDSGAIGSGTTFGPGESVTEVRSDGDIVLADPPILSGSAPNYVFAVEPGEPILVHTVVRNTWPLPIRLLGHIDPRAAPDDSPHPSRYPAVIGLGLLVDAAQPLTEANVRPFEPVDLPPGGEAHLVIIRLAPACASGDISTLPRGSEMRGDVHRFVYETLGWRGIGVLRPPFEVTVPVHLDC
jgi:hypothetical protein